MTLPASEEACEQLVEILRHIDENEVLLAVADGFLFKSSDHPTRPSVATQSFSHAEETLRDHAKLLREQALLFLPIFSSGCRIDSENKSIGSRNAPPPRFLDFSFFLRKVRTLRDRTRQAGVAFSSLKHVGLLSEESFGRRVITDRALVAVQGLLDGLVDVAAALADTPAPHRAGAAPLPEPRPGPGLELEPGLEPRPHGATPLPLPRSGPDGEGAPRHSLSRPSASQQRGEEKQARDVGRPPLPEGKAPGASSALPSVSEFELNGGIFDESMVIRSNSSEVKQGKVKLNEVQPNEVKTSESRFSAKSKLRGAALTSGETVYKSDSERTPLSSPQLHFESHESEASRVLQSSTGHSPLRALSLSESCGVVNYHASIAGAHATAHADTRGVNFPVETRVTAQSRVFSGNKWSILFRSDGNSEEGNNNWRGVFISEVALLFGIPCDWVMNVTPVLAEDSDGDAVVKFDLRLPESITDDEIVHRIRYHDFTTMFLLYEQIPVTPLPTPPIPAYFEGTYAPFHSASDSLEDKEKEEEEEGEDERKESLALILEQLENAESLARDFICRDEQHKRGLILVTVEQSHRMRERQRLRALAFHAETLISRHRCADEGIRELGKVGVVVEKEGGEGGGGKEGNGIIEDDEKRGVEEGRNKSKVKIDGEEDGTEYASRREKTGDTPLPTTAVEDKANSSGSAHLSSPSPPPPFSHSFPLSFSDSSPQSLSNGSRTGNSFNLSILREGAKNVCSTALRDQSSGSRAAEKSSREDKLLTTAHVKVLRGDAWDTVLEREKDELNRTFSVELAELFELPVENVRDVCFSLGSLHASFELVHDQYLKEVEINELLALFDFPRVRALYKQCVDKEGRSTSPPQLHTISNGNPLCEGIHTGIASISAENVDAQENELASLRIMDGFHSLHGTERFHRLSARGVRYERDEGERVTSQFCTDTATPDNEPVTFSHLALVHDVPLHLLLDANPQLRGFGPCDALPERSSVIIPRAVTDDMRCNASSALDACDVRSSSCATPFITSPLRTHPWTSRDSDNTHARTPPAMSLKTVAQRMNVSVQSLRQRNAHLDSYGDTETLPRNCSINVSALFFAAEPMSGMSSIRSSPRSPGFPLRDISMRSTIASLTPRREQQQLHQEEGEGHEEQQSKLQETMRVCTGKKSPSRDSCEALSELPLPILSAVRFGKRVQAIDFSPHECSPAKTSSPPGRESGTTDAALRHERAVTVMAHSASKFIQLRYFTLWLFAVRLRPRRRAEPESATAKRTRVAPALRPARSSRPAVPAPRCLRPSPRARPDRAERAERPDKDEKPERTERAVAAAAVAALPGTGGGPGGLSARRRLSLTPSLRGARSRAASASSQSRDGRSPRIANPPGLDERIAATHFVLDMRVSPSMFVVEARGAAAAAGARKGDEVREVNSARVRSAAEFRAAVEEVKQGVPHVRIAVRRAGTVVKLCISRSGDKEEAGIEAEAGTIRRRTRSIGRSEQSCRMR